MTIPSSAPDTTKVLRDQLTRTLFKAFNSQSNTLVVAPTSLGKTHTISSLPWKTVLAKAEHDSPLIHISQTTKARDEAVQNSRKAGLREHVLKGREESCPVAGGDHDDTIIIPEERLSAYEWFKLKCDIKQVPFSDAHRELDQSTGGLPCTASGPCLSTAQWERYYTDTDSFDIIHVTDTFAYNHNLIEDAYVVFDEQPDYTTGIKDQTTTATHDADGSIATGPYLTRENIRQSVTQFLQASDPDNPLNNWEALLTGVRNEQPKAIEYFHSILAEVELEPDWILETPYVQTSTPAIIQAILNAKEVGNGRYHGEGTLSNSPWYPDQSADANRVGVVFDTQNNIRLLHTPPDLSPAKCVIGLDAHPTERLWTLNTGVDFTVRELEVAPEVIREWRRSERQLTVYQVGDATRQYTRGWAGATPEARDRLRARAKALIAAMREKFGTEFRTAITTKALHSDITQMMTESGVRDPEVLYYGHIKSRNDFSGETVGLLIGCNDPGDENILDILALLELYAEAPMVENSSGKMVRKPDREFEGPDADAANEILESVREMNVAQAIGRYARTAGRTDSGAVVYVWTNAIPEDLVDGYVPGVERVLINKQKAIIELVSQADSWMTCKQVVDSLHTERQSEVVSKNHVRNTLDEFVAEEKAERSEGTGYYGAHEYWIDSDVVTSRVDLEPNSSKE